MENTTPAQPKKIGRPAGSINKRTMFAREWIERSGFQDPLEFLVRCLNADSIEVTKADAEGKVVLDANGQPVKEMLVIPLDTRLRAAQELLPYVYLSSII